MSDYHDLWILNNDENIVQDGNDKIKRAISLIKIDLRGFVIRL